MTTSYVSGLSVKLTLLSALFAAVTALTCHECADAKFKDANSEQQLCSDVSLSGSETECGVGQDICYTLSVTYSGAEDEDDVTATVAGCGVTDKWMEDKAAQCSDWDVECSNVTCEKDLCNAVDIRGYELYEPAPYESKKWLLPGLILSFLIILILLMLLMNVKERSDRYKLFTAEQRKRAEDGKTNGKVTQHFSLPPGIDISKEVYPSKSMDA